MELNNVILKPYLTEKSFQIKNQHERQVLTFLVNPKATKHHIKNAFILLFNQKPEKINVVVKKPARIRLGTRTPGYSKLKKVAYITMPKGVNVAVTNEEIESAQAENTSK